MQIQLSNILLFGHLSFLKTFSKPNYLLLPSRTPL